MTPLFETLIDAVDLRSLLSSGAAVVVLDSGFDLFDPAAGDRAYAAGHLPGALRADLDRDLSGAKTGRNGRHPLPARELFAVTAGRWGIAPGVQVVVYDDQGASFAARAWWMLRWIGHRAVAVLDGGRGAWVASGGPLETGVVEPRPAGPYPMADGGAPTIDADALQAALHRLCIVDARAGERFRGEVEPLDPVAGHIPGARHRFFRDNLAADGRFKPAVALRAEFEALAVPPDRVVHQCGSGVTACHNLLAMEHAGLAGSVLYPGSWSEWCADPARPVARG